MTGSAESWCGSCSVRAEQDENGRVYVRVSGELDLFTAPQLRRALEQDASEFVVDLLDCAFVDWTGPGVLVAAQARGGRLALIAPGPHVSRSLELSGLDRVIPVYGSRGSPSGVPAHA